MCDRQGEIEMKFRLWNEAESIARDCGARNLVANIASARAWDALKSADVDLAARLYRESARDQLDPGHMAPLLLGISKLAATLGNPSLAATAMGARTALLGQIFPDEDTSLASAIAGRSKEYWLVEQWLRDIYADRANQTPFERGKKMDPQEAANYVLDGLLPAASVS